MSSPTALASSVGTLHRRDYFYIGYQCEEIVLDDEGNYSSSTTTAGQMYVEHLVPMEVTRPYPLLMIHGHGMTGTNFLNTPDGRLGWADYFMSKGYEIYIVDQPCRGRSPWLANVNGPRSMLDSRIVQALFTATSKHNRWPQAKLHTQWPGSGTAGDPIFDQFYASMVPSLSSDRDTATKMKAAGSALLERIGPVILLTHSQSGQHGWLLADSRPNRVVAIVSLEPSGPPFANAIFPSSSSHPRQYGITDIPITYSPPITSPDQLSKELVPSESDLGFSWFRQASPPRQLINLKSIPVLIVTSEASYHAVYDHATAAYLSQAGVQVKHVKLADAGIHGNGHMMFLEKNSDRIAEEVVGKWLNSVMIMVNMLREHTE